MTYEGTRELTEKPPSNPRGSDGGAASDPTRMRSCSADETIAIGATVARHLVCGDLIALIGELGAGKTQFVRGLAQGLGMSGAEVSSPSFVLMHEYDGSPEVPVLVHVDAYRTGGASDLDSIGWDDASNEHRAGAVVALEWADRLSDRLGDDVLRVRMDHVDPTTRLITFEPSGSWLQRMAPLVTALRAMQSVAAEPEGPGDMPMESMDSERDPGVPSRCPICDGQVDQGATTIPFCSSRCRLVDLNRWLNGQYVISRPIAEADEDDD